MRVLVVVLAVLVSGCASTNQMSRDRLERWTRHYEKKLKTAKHEVRFVEPGVRSELPNCAWSDIEGGRLVVYYDLNCRRGIVLGEVVVNERVLARHEVLHEYLNHHRRDWPPDLEEQEVWLCEGVVR